MLTPSRLVPTLLIVAAAMVGVATPAGAQTTVPGEVVVRYARDADRGDRAAVQRQTGVGQPHAFAPRTRVLKIRDGESVAETVAELRARPEVATAAPNAIAHSSAFIPSDPGDTGMAGGWQQLQWNFLAGVGVNAPDAWQHLNDAGRPGGRGVVVAVLDTGVAYADRQSFRRSPDFRRGDFMRGYDFVDNDRFPNDENGHGTHVAGTIGESTDNDTGLTGLAYGATILPVRVLNADGAGESVEITAGIRYAVRRGADVINLSFEFDSRFGQASASEIPDILAALRYARRHNVLVVAAVGNQARQTIAYPARHETVIGVGATTEHGCLARYSNVGRGIDIVAPGGGTDSRNADAACPPEQPRGRDIYQMTFPWAAALNPPHTASRYRRFGLPDGFVGTSMAAPHVSAIAALVIASGLLGPDPTPEAIEDRLKAMAVDGGVPGFDDAYGAGRIDAAAATDPAR